MLFSKVNREGQLMLMNHNKIFVAENSIEKHTPSLLPSPLNLVNISCSIGIWGEGGQYFFALSNKILSFKIFTFTSVI